MINDMNDLMSKLPNVRSFDILYNESDNFFSDDVQFTLPKSQYKNHCFSRGFLYYASGYQKLIPARKVVLVNKSILIDITVQKKLRTSIIAELQDPNDIEIVKVCREEGYVRSPYDLKIGNFSRHAEVVHNLESVFSPESYKNSKKRNQRIHQPLKVISENNIELRKLGSDNVADIDAFCETWTALKLENPKVFKMMFSNPNKHIKMAIEDGQFGEVWGYFIDGKMCNLQLFSVEDDVAYSLYNVTTRDKELDSRINAACYLHIMQHLKNLGVKEWNVGLALNPSLSAFKHHYPHEDISYFHYSKLST